MKEYKIGIIGYGGFGKFLHHWWNQLDNVTVAAVADHGPHAKDVEGCKVYHSWEDLINDPEIDIVSIVTPPGLHAKMACAAMRAGKHVLLEKPLAITAETAQQIIDVQKETGRAITVNHMIRYNPIIQAFMDLGQSGTLGKLRHVVVNNYAQDASLPVDHWFWNNESSGGILVEHGVHFFDIVNALGKEQYVSVSGSSHDRNERQRDRVTATVLYNEGLIASYYHAFAGPAFFEQTTIHLAYDLARVEIEGWMPMTGKMEAMVNERTKEQLTQIPGWRNAKSEPIAQVTGMYRPNDDGASDPSTATNAILTNCGGIMYDVDEIISGTFGLEQSKGDIYGKCVQSVLLDLIEKAEDPGHQMTITVEDALVALEIALLASK